MHFFGQALQKWPSKENINSQWLFMPTVVRSNHATIEKVPKMGLFQWYTVIDEVRTLCLFFRMPE